MSDPDGNEFCAFTDWKRSQARKSATHLAQPVAGVLLEEVPGPLEDQVVEASRAFGIARCSAGMSPVIGSPSLNAAGCGEGRA